MNPAALPSLGIHIPEQHRRETTLLLQCASVGSEPLRDNNDRGFHTQGIDWAYVVRKAAEHGLTALVYRNLRAAPIREDAPDAFSMLEEAARQQAFRATYLAGRLTQLTAQFHAEGIRVLALKGPVLAAQYYGDATLRTFLDLDILVRREQLPGAVALLKREGFRPHRQRSAAEEDAHIRSQMGYEFIGADTVTVVELHWSFLNVIHAFRMDPEEVFEAAIGTSLLGKPILSMRPEHLLVYLCAHGSKHVWGSLNLVCDVDALIRSERTLDWDFVAATTRRLHARRMVLLGLCLSAGLLSTPVPEAILERSKGDRVLQRMLDRCCGWLLGESSIYVPERAQYRFHLEMRERLRDRLPYYAHLLRIHLPITR